MRWFLWRILHWLAPYGEEFLVELHKMKRVKCQLCGDMDGYEHVVLINTNPNDPVQGSRRFVTVMRCATCDTVPCPNVGCKTRTLKVNATHCVACGVALMPGRG